MVFNYVLFLFFGEFVDLLPLISFGEKNCALRLCRQLLSKECSFQHTIAVEMNPLRFCLKYKIYLN